MLIQPLRRERETEQDASMSFFRVVFTGQIDPDGIANTLRSVIGATRRTGKVELSFWADRDKPEDLTF